MGQSTTISQEQQQILDEQGAIVIPDVLTSDEIDRYKRVFGVGEQTEQEVEV